MGEYFTDRFSLLHFMSGIMFYFMGITFSTSFVAHLLFEVVENEEYVIETTSKLKWWPGGKHSQDTTTNSLGDQFYFSIGWLLSSYFNTKI